MKKRNNKYIKLGIFLMVFSGVFFAATLIIPFFDLPTKTKVIASTTSFVLMEVVFWLGGLLVGKELFTRYKKKLDPRNWFRKKDDRIEEPEKNTEKSASIKESGIQPKP